MCPLSLFSNDWIYICVDNSAVVNSTPSHYHHMKKPCNIKYCAQTTQCNFYLESEQISFQPKLLFVLDKYIGLYGRPANIPPETDLRCTKLWKCNIAFLLTPGISNLYQDRLVWSPIHCKHYNLWSHAPNIGTPTLHCHVRKPQQISVKENKKSL